MKNICLKGFFLIILCFTLAACFTEKSSNKEESSNIFNETEQTTEENTQSIVYKVEKIEIIDEEDNVINSDTWIVGKATCMKFSLNGDYAKFKNIDIDGSRLYSNGYTIEDDGKKISIPANYFDNYALIGEHTFTVNYEDGQATITFYTELEQLPPLEGYYEYPVTPDDEEWEKMDLDKKLEICKIPQNVLDSMNDEQLIHAVLDYPFLVNVPLFLSDKTTLESSICDAFEELLNRESGKDSCINFIKDNYVSNKLEAQDLEERWFITLVRCNERMREKLTEEDFEIINSTRNDEWKHDYGDWNDNNQ